MRSRHRCRDTALSSTRRQQVFLRTVTHVTLRQDTALRCVTCSRCSTAVGSFHSVDVRRGHREWRSEVCVPATARAGLSAAAWWGCAFTAAALGPAQRPTVPMPAPLDPTGEVWPMATGRARRSLYTWPHIHGRGAGRRSAPDDSAAPDRQPEGILDAGANGRGLPSLSRQ